MSIEPSTLVPSDTDAFPPEFPTEPSSEASPVVVRRNAGISALVGAAASAMAIAYLWRATETAAVLDWALCLVLAAIAVLHLAQLVDARTPLLVADELGVRMRFGHQWRGLPWDAIGSAGVRPRHGLLHDGRLMFAPHSLGRALEGLDARGRRAAALNQKLYGAALAVPMGLTTRVSHRQEALVDSLAALSQGRTDVIVLEPVEADPEQLVEADDVALEEQPEEAFESAAPPEDLQDADATRDDEPEELEDVEDPQDTFEVQDTEDPDDAGSPDAAGRPRHALGRLGTAVSRLGRGRSRDVDAPPAAEPDEEPWQPEQPKQPEQPDVVADTPDEQPVPFEEPVLADEQSEAVEAAQDEAAQDEAAQDEAAQDDSSQDEPGDDQAPEPHAPAARGARALGGARRVLRAQIGRGESHATLGNAALLPDRKSSRRRAELPETEHLRRAGDPDLVGDDGLVDLGTEPTEPIGSMVTIRHPEGVRPIATLHDPVDPLVVDEFVTEPAYDPVIGPELAAARHRTGLSVDQLAERTRIRPHVIESIEVDDFAPCGGDFYARGHLRTLARVLGRDPEKLLALYDQRYATAPINARRVFEAELATGMTGSVRRAGGGPNWALLIGVVLALVMTWGVVRLFASEPQEQLQSPVPTLNGSAGVAGDAKQSAPTPAAAPKPVQLRVTAAHAATHVVVRDRSGKVVWAGDLALGQSRTQRVTPPAKVHADNAGALDVAVGGHVEGRLGTLGQPGQRSFGGS